jgi:hypothetical protein
MPKPVLIHVDSPSQMPLDGRVRVRGWVASDAGLVSVSAGSFRGGDVMAWEDRPDVAAANPAYAHTSGFCGVIDEGRIDAGRLVIACTSASGTDHLELLLPFQSPAPGKAGRLARIRPHLRKDLPFRETPFHFDFLTPEMRARFSVADTGSVSNFEYAPGVRAEIDRCGDELVLACGAGNRPSTWPNIINLEIVAHSSTDILAVNESLPFEDATFAMVVSCAVPEHLNDPSAAAREMVRVTRPGGIIYADIPFLEPASANSVVARKV